MAHLIAAKRARDSEKLEQAENSSIRQHDSPEAWVVDRPMSSHSAISGKGRGLPCIWTRELSADSFGPTSNTDYMHNGFVDDFHHLDDLPNIVHDTVRLAAEGHAGLVIEECTATPPGSAVRRAARMSPPPIPPTAAFDSEPQLHHMLKSWHDELRSRLTVLDSKLDLLLSHIGAGNIKEKGAKNFVRFPFPSQGNASPEASQTPRAPSLALAPNKQHKSNGRATAIPQASQPRKTAGAGMCSLEPDAAAVRRGARATRILTKGPILPMSEVIRTFESRLASQVSAFDDNCSESSIQRANLGGAFEAADKLFNNSRNDICSTVWEFMEAPETSNATMSYTIFMQFLAVFAAMVAFMQTMETPPLDANISVMVDLCLESVFLLEIFLRFTVSVSTRVFFINGFNLLDFLSVVPLLVRIALGPGLPFSYMSMTESQNLLVPVTCCRLLRLLRNFHMFHLLLNAFRTALEAMPFLLYTWVILALSFSAAIHIIEPRSNLPTYPSTLWFTIVTMTTIGYGDMTPATDGGRFLVSVLAICSALFMAIPIGIVGNAFTVVWADRDRLLLMRRTQERLIQGGYAGQDIPELFSVFDPTTGGEITVQAFLEMIKSMRVGIPEVRAIKLFRTLDEDHSGLVSCEEFVKHLFPDAHAEIYGSGRTTKEEEVATPFMLSINGRLVHEEGGAATASREREVSKTSSIISDD